MTAFNSDITFSGDDSHADSLAAFPQELKNLKVWCLWRYETRGDKQTKVPYQLNKTFGAKSNDPSTWATFDEVCAACGGGEGREFSPGVMADGSYSFIDLDKCVEDGRIAPWAQAVLFRCKSYAEFSPSGTGVHIFVRGVSDAAKKDGCEIYSTARFFTVTGRHIAGTPTVIDDMDADALKELRSDINDCCLRPQSASATSGTRTRSGASGTGSIIVTRPMTQKEREQKLARILSGDTSDFHSRSEAIISAMQILARKHDGDEEKIREEFEGTEMHAKWSDKWGRLGGEEIQKGVSWWEENGKPPWENFLQTDGGNAKRLVALHGENFRYLHEEKIWLHWDGKRWKRDATAEIDRAARDTVREMYTEAQEIENEDARKAFSKFVLRSDAAAGRINMVTLARQEEIISACAEDFDKNQFYLNLQNGTYHLGIGTLLPHDKADLITKICPVSYDPQATCPKFTEFLNETFTDQPDVIPFLQRSFGYSLTGSIAEQCFWLLIGGGQNGKTVLLNALQYVLGDYAIETSFDVFMAKKNEGRAIDPRDGLASLQGARFVRASEAQEERRFNEATIKNITGGEKIRTAKMYEEEFQYLPTFKIWLSTNHEPSIRGTDDGIWRRIQRVNFNQRVPEDRVNRGLVAELETESSGILNWALEGYAAYKKVGLLPPAAVKAAMEGYRQGQNPLKDFVEQRCDVSNSLAETSSALLQSEYENWARLHRRSHMSAQSFGRALGQILGHTSKGKREGGKVVQFWPGIAVNPQVTVGDVGDKGGISEKSRVEIAIGKLSETGVLSPTSPTENPVDDAELVDLCLSDVEFWAPEGGA